MNMIEMDPEVLTRKSIRQYQENTCNVCHTQFSLSNRSVLCSKCFQKTCRLHITTEKTQTTCEICIRTELKRVSLQEKQDTITILRNELRSLQHREKANLKEIGVKTETIFNLEKTINEQQIVHNIKYQEIEKSISDEINQTECFNSKIIEMIAEIETSKTTHKLIQERFANATTDLVKIQKNYSIIRSEHNSLKKQANLLIEESEKMITFQRVRTTTCNKCCKSIIIMFKDQIISILSRKEKNSMIADILEIDTITSDNNITSESCKCLIF